MSRMLVSAGLASSNGEAKRLINQRAVQVIGPDGQSRVVSGDSLDEGIHPGAVLRVGRRRFLRLTS